MLIHPLLAQTQALGSVVRVQAVVNLEPHHPGTGFVVSHAEARFLITAAHNVSSAPECDLRLLSPQSLDLHELTLTRVDDPLDSADDDVAVFSLPYELGPHAFAMPLGDECLRLSQEVLVLGFPQGMDIRTGAWTGTPADFPIVKKGIVAAMSDVDGQRRLLLDMVANPGMSGGPVIFNGGNSIEDLRIAGMVRQTATQADLTHGDAGGRMYADITVATFASDLRRYLSS